MVKVVLIYGSTTGNTEALSEHVAAGLERGMAEVTVKDVAKASVDELANYVYFFYKKQRLERRYGRIYTPPSGI